MAAPVASVVTVPSVVLPSRVTVNVRLGYQPASRTVVVPGTVTVAGSRVSVPCRIVGRIRTTCGSWSEAWSANSALMWTTWYSTSVTGLVTKMWSRTWLTPLNTYVYCSFSGNVVMRSVKTEPLSVRCSSTGRTGSR